MNSNWMLNGIGDSGATSCPSGSSMQATATADGSMDWSCVEDCDEICQAANAPTIDGFSCPSGYSIVSLADGTKNCVADSAGQPAKPGDPACPAGQSLIKGWLPFMPDVCAPTTVPPVPTPWYKKPMILVGLLVVIGGGVAVYAHSRKMP